MKKKNLTSELGLPGIKLLVSNSFEQTGLIRRQNEIFTELCNILQRIEVQIRVDCRHRRRISESDERRKRKSDKFFTMVMPAAKIAIHDFMQPKPLKFMKVVGPVPAPPYVGPGIVKPPTPPKKSGS